MKKISLIQVNFQQGPEDLNAYYLPYSVGCIWSYAQSFEEIQQRYELHHVLWRRMPVDQTAELLSKQDIVVFSCYVWNKNYNYALAQAIKKVNPDCTIMFGGPEMPVTDPDIFKRHPYIDFVIKKEGEITFSNCLLKFNNISSVPGILINQQGKAVDTGDAPRIDDLGMLPSPYLTGFFDDLIANYPEIEWMATLESNRGCPYQCTFCDWGSLTYQKVRKFKMEKVLAEIEWISRNRCGAIMVADANFGIFPDRDNEIVDHFVACRDKYGYPPHWVATWAKNQRKEVMGIVKKLDTGQHFTNGLNLSLQSLTDQVLINIKRKNMHDMTLQEMYQIAEQGQNPTQTELILGLPGETLASWKETFFKMMRMEVHCYADVSYAQMLENAEMNLVQRQIYDIKTKEVFDYLSSTHNIDQWRESIHVVTSTRDMPPDHMIEAILFTWFINTFHFQNFSVFVSRFLSRCKNIDYRDFYDSLYEIASADTWFSEQMQIMEQSIHVWFDCGELLHPPLANGVKITSWNLFSSAAMKIHLEQRYDQIFAMVETAAASFGLDGPLLEDVMTFQKLFVVNLNDLMSYPRRQKFNFNIEQVVFSNAELKSHVHELEFDFRHPKKSLDREYIERIYYSRKQQFTKTMVRSGHSQLHHAVG